jgi:hypothetical protein
MDRYLGRLFSDSGNKFVRPAGQKFITVGVPQPDFCFPNVIAIAALTRQNSIADIYSKVGGERHAAFPRVVSHRL